MRVCPYCGVHFDVTHWRKEYCCVEHQRAAYIAKTKPSLAVATAANRKRYNHKYANKQARYYRVMRGSVRRKCTRCNLPHCDVCELYSLKVYIDSKENKNAK